MPRTVEEIVDYAIRMDSIMECALDPVPVASDEFPLLLAIATKLSMKGDRTVSITDLLCGHRMELL